MIPMGEMRRWVDHQMNRNNAQIPPVHEQIAKAKEAVQKMEERLNRIEEFVLPQLQQQAAESIAAQQEILDELIAKKDEAFSAAALQRDNSQVALGGIQVIYDGALVKASESNSLLNEKIAQNRELQSRFDRVQQLKDKQKQERNSKQVKQFTKDAAYRGGSWGAK